MCAQCKNRGYAHPRQPFLLRVLASAPYFSRLFQSDNTTGANRRSDGGVACLSPVDMLSGHVAHLCLTRQGVVWPIGQGGHVATLCLLPLKKPIWHGACSHIALLRFGSLVTPAPPSPLAQALPCPGTGPRLTVAFLTFRVLAQGGGG